ncbi:MAG: hypothetical protein WDN24_07420 [Sphingomonas sp.]
MLPDLRREVKALLPLAFVLLAGCIPRGAEPRGYDRPARGAPYDPTAAPRYGQDVPALPAPRQPWRCAPSAPTRAASRQGPIRCGAAIRCG